MNMQDLNISCEEFLIINKFAEMEQCFSKLDLETKECMKAYLIQKIKKI